MKYGNIDIDIEKNIISYNGQELPSSVASDICLGYERLCTARFLMYDHGISNQETAWNIANDVRDMMDDYGITESEAIIECLNEIKQDKETKYRRYPVEI